MNCLWLEAALKTNLRLVLTVLGPMVGSPYECWTYRRVVCVCLARISELELTCSVVGEITHRNVMLKCLRRATRRFVLRLSRGAASLIWRPLQRWLFLQGVRRGFRFCFLLHSVSHNVVDPDLNRLL
jgi:hypothetical protein